MHDRDHLTPLQRQILRVTQGITPSSEGITIADALEQALCDCLGDKPWTHPGSHEIRRRLKSDAYPSVKDIEDVGAVYLSQPQRTPELDRLLIDLMLASEFFSYARHRGAMVWLELSGIAMNVAVAYGIAYWIDTNISYAIATIFMIWSFGGLIWNGRKARRLLTSMGSTYNLLNGRIVSLPHLRTYVRQSTDVGVVWPATMHALLDDIETRTTRI